MSTWHKQVTQSLADSVSAILSDMKEDQKGTQNGMLKKGKGEPAGQIKPKQDIPEEDDDKSGKKLDPVDKNAVKKKFKDRKDQDLDNDGDTDSSDKFLHKKRKAITKAIRNTSESGKKVKLSGKKEPVAIGAVKENVIVGRLIPAGTGSLLRDYKKIARTRDDQIRVKGEREPVTPSSR